MAARGPSAGRRRVGRRQRAVGSEAKPTAVEPAKLLEAVRAQALGAGLDEAPSRFGGALAWRRGTREVGHVHERGPEGETDDRAPALWLDVRLPRADRPTDPRVVLRGKSDWVEVRVRTRTDVAFAAELLALAR